ncbi:hypothetical protein A33M_3260 [Rhodovulum sp. PH10]|nr:hypothetical protein A33M_3260 [Rhodovulum sp. PH10]
MPIRLAIGSAGSTPPTRMLARLVAGLVVQTNRQLTEP